MDYFEMGHIFTKSSCTSGSSDRLTWDVVIRLYNYRFGKRSSGLDLDRNSLFGYFPVLRYLGIIEADGLIARVSLVVSKVAHTTVWATYLAEGY